MPFHCPVYRIEIIIPYILPVLVIYRVVRVQLRVLRETPVRTILSLGHGISQLVSGHHIPGKPVRQRNIYPVIPAIITFHHPVCIRQPSRYLVLDSATPPGHRGRVTMRESIPQRFRRPIRVDTPADILQLVIISRVKTTIYPVIQSRQTLQFQLFLRITQAKRGQVRKTEHWREIITESRLIRLSPHPFHQNHTVCSFLPVKYRRGCILQHQYLFYIVNIQIIQILHGNLHPVQHNQGSVHPFLSLCHD